MFVVANGAGNDRLVANSNQPEDLASTENETGFCLFALISHL